MLLPLKPVARPGVRPLPLALLAFGRGDARNQLFQEAHVVVELDILRPEVDELEHRVEEEVEVERAGALRVVPPVLVRALPRVALVEGLAALFHEEVTHREVVVEILVAKEAEGLCLGRVP